MHQLIQLNHELVQYMGLLLHALQDQEIHSRAVLLALCCALRPFCHVTISAVPYLPCICNVAGIPAAGDTVALYPGENKKYAMGRCNGTVQLCVTWGMASQFVVLGTQWNLICVLCVCRLPAQRWVSLSLRPRSLPAMVALS